MPGGVVGFFPGSYTHEIPKGIKQGGAGGGGEKKKGRGEKGKGEGEKRVERRVMPDKPICVAMATHDYTANNVPEGQQKHHLFFQKGLYISILIFSFFFFFFLFFSFLFLFLFLSLKIKPYSFPLSRRSRRSLCPKPKWVVERRKRRKTRCLSWLFCSSCRRKSQRKRRGSRNIHRRSW